MQQKYYHNEKRWLLIILFNFSEIPFFPAQIMYPALPNSSGFHSNQKLKQAKGDFCDKWSNHIGGLKHAHMDTYPFPSTNVITKMKMILKAAPFG